MSTKNESTPAERLMEALREASRVRSERQQEESRKARGASARPQVAKPATRYSHVSKVYVRNPDYNKRQGDGSVDFRPFLASHGNTYNAGRNALKRKNRRLAILLRNRRPGPPSRLTSNWPVSAKARALRGSSSAR